MKASKKARRAKLALKLQMEISETVNSLRAHDKICQKLYKRYNTLLIRKYRTLGIIVQIGPIENIYHNQ